MTSVQNHLQQLNGSKFLLILLSVFLFVQSCQTPRPQRPQPRPDERTEERRPPRPDKKIDSLDLVYPVITKQEYNIAFLLPFFLDSEERKTQRRNVTSKVATDYYMGAMLAMDTLRSCGINLNVTAIDTRIDSADVAVSLEQLYGKDIDFIIGPLFRNNLAPVYRYSAENQINFLSPFFYFHEADEPNPYFLVGIPRESDFGKAAAEFVNRRFSGENLIVLKQPLPNEQRMTEGFRAGLNPGIAEKLIDKTVTAGSLSNNFPLEIFGSNNLIFVPSDEEEFVTNIVNGLISNEINATVIGLSKWVDLRTVDPKNLEKLNLHLISSYHIDYRAPHTIKFMERYKKKFKGEPGEFAFRGYDDVLMLFSRMNQSGKYFQRHLTNTNYQLLHTNYIFEKDPVTQGYVNTYLHMLRLRDMELQKVTY
jgi:ABC-type branched-subunit amino acid transport system substrate-binding protein